MKHKEKKKHLERRCNIQQDVPQTQTFMEAPGHSQAAGENTSSSEYFTCASSLSKLPHHDDNGFHQLQQNVPYLRKLNMPKSQSTWKRIMEWYERGPCNIQQDVPQNQSFMETPGYNEAAGENEHSSEYFTCATSLTRFSYDDDNGFHQLQQNVPYLRELNMPTCQSAWKRIMEWFKEGRCNIQQDVPQTQTFMEAPGYSQAAGENASSSEYSTSDSSLSKRPRHDDDGFHQLQQNVPDLEELNMPASQSAWKRIMEWYKGGFHQLQQNVPYLRELNMPTSQSAWTRIMEWFKEGPCNIQQDSPQPQSLMEAPGCSQAAGENAFSSEYFTCVSSPSKLPHHDDNGFHQLQQNVPYLRELNMPASRLARKRKIMEEHIGGPRPCNIQQDTPLPESRVEAPGCSQAAGGSASSSVYFTCVSSPSKLPCPNRDGFKERPGPKDLMQTETSSDYSYTSNSSHSASNKDPSLMKIYYMRVQMKRGVAVLCHTGEGWEPPSKKIKMEEMTYTTEVHKNVPLSDISGKNLLNDPEPTVDSPAQENREKAGCSTEPPTLVVYRRVQLRRALDSGFRCLACCHVFASLEVLQQHVEHGVQEGFSCHVFHRAMARMKYKKLKRKNKKLMKAALSCQAKEDFDTKTNLDN